MKKNKKRMEQGSLSALWIVAGLAMVAGVAWGIYKNKVAQKREEEEKIGSGKKRDLNQLRLLANSCWDTFVAFQKQDRAFDTWRSFISANGILFDYQLLMGIIQQEMEDEQKGKIIQNVIGNNLINLLESKLVCENGIWKVRDDGNYSITRESYLYNLGYRGNTEENPDIVIAKMTRELQHQKEKIAHQQEDENYKFYGQLFDKLMPFISNFSGSIHADGLDTQEVLKLGRNLADNMHDVLQANGIATIFYKDCPEEKKNLWFIPSTNGRELPAILRTSMQSLYAKGTNKNI